MPDFLTLTCPTCGAKLKLADQINLLVCASCGNEHIVHRDGGAIFLAPMAQDVRHIRAGVDKTAAELAIIRLPKEIDDLEAGLNPLMSRQASYFAQQQNSVGNSAFFATLTLIVLVGFIATVIFGSMGYAVLLFVCLGFSVSFWVMSRRTKPEVTKTPFDLEIERLSTELDAKRAQLRHNRQIANT